MRGRFRVNPIGRPKNARLSTGYGVPLLSQGEKGLAPGAYALPFARRRPHLDGSLVRELRAELGQSSSTFPRIDSYRLESRCVCGSQPTRAVRRFSSRSENFACDLDNFACETILFRQ